MTLREQLENPELFQVNRMQAHSDHLLMNCVAGGADDTPEEEKADRVNGTGVSCQKLDGEWEFKYSRCLEERPEDFFREDASLSGFGTIRVPGHIELQGYGKPQYINTLFPWDGVEYLRPPKMPERNCAVGSYRRSFDLEEGCTEGGEVFLSFEGVENAFSVWLNGVYLGYSEDSFTPSEFCITELVRPKGNLLAVEVYQRSSASWLEDQDFWRFFGIFRSVSVIRVPAVHIYDLKVTADYAYQDDFLPADGNGWEPAKKGDGLLTVTALVLADAMPEDEDITLQFGEFQPEGAALRKADGQSLNGSNASGIRVQLLSSEDAGELGLTVPPAEAACPFQMRERRRKLYRLTWRCNVGTVRPWSAEQPDLYTVTLTVKGEGEEPAETIRQSLGFRTFEMKNGVMCLNGKRIIFRGVNRHEFCYRGGRCISDPDMQCDVALIKNNNMNAVRTCHYPNRSGWYRLCDEAGLYLIDETNLETHGTWQKLGKCEPSWNVPGSLPEWEAAVLDRARSMYERDKNHPSVLIWSCGNESYAGEDIARMSEYFHAVDPRRLVHYEGCFWNPAYRYISDMESRMYAKPAEVAAYLEEELAKKAADPSYVTKPYISCEYMHAMGNSLGGMQLYTELEDRYEGYQGGFIWDFIDQVLPLQLPDGREVMAVGGDFDDRPTDYGFCTNGIVYGDRTPSPKMPEVRQLYSPVRLDVSPEELTVENRNLFTDTSEYLFVVRGLLDGQVLEERTIEVSAAAGETVTVPHGIRMPEDGLGVIEAFAYARGQEASSCIEAAGQDVRQDTGRAVAFAQCIREQGKRAVSGFPVPGSFVQGDGHLGILGDDWQIQFSMPEGGITSYTFGGREYIDRVPRISFWRAMTDNDCGAGYPAEMGVWYATGHFMKKDYSRFRIEPVEGGLRMTTVFTGGPAGAVEVTVSYTVYPDGRILVEADFPGIGGYPELPVFAMDFCTKPDVDRVEYLGLGPEENYIDRTAGARLGRFRFTAAENLSGYLRPQECGNRTGVREMTVTGADGRGIRFTAEGDPFEMSVLPYSAYELEEANRIFELPKVRHTWIRIASEEMGVGGDDSWGAPVHEEYRIDSGKPQHLAFWITPVEVR